MLNLSDIPLSKEITDNFTVVNNTLVSKNKEYEVEIGDIKQTDFMPQTKIKRWLNECNFSMRLVENGLDSPVLTEDAGVLKWTKNDIEVQYRDGGRDFIVILKNKPVSNVLTFTINTKELKYLPQGIWRDGEDKEITEYADARGDLHRRLANVNGSFAVYHITKQGYMLGDQNYRSGKAFHIYRPKVEESSSKWVLGDLNINVPSGLLTITIDQTFLDTAIYPVRVWGDY